MKNLIPMIATLLIPLVLHAQEAKPLRLATEKDDALYRSFLPKTTDEQLQELFKKPLTFYTDKEIPPAFQDDGGCFAPSNNYSANQFPGGYPARHFGGREPYGNANVEFPWGSPNGGHLSRNLKSIRFMYLPEGEKITYWTEVLRGDESPRGNGVSYTNVVWRFPKGTVFGEVMLVTDAKGYSVTFEVRIRTKVKDGDWKSNTYRPFPTVDDLVKALDALPAKIKDDSDVAKLQASLRRPTVSKERIRNDHTRVIFDETAGVENLPAIPADVVKHLLDETPFKSALGSEWRSVDGMVSYAPSTKEKFHVVPTDYRASHIEVDSKSCMRCHDTVQLRADAMQNRFSDGTIRDWYGRVRGSDNIFSFHPFTKESINTSSGSTVFKRELRKELSEVLENKK